MVKSKNISAGTIPTVRIVRPSGRPFQLRYDCPNEKRQIRISVGSRDEVTAQRKKKELEAKLLLGIEIKQKKKCYGPEMLWSDFRDEYTTHHLSHLRDSSASHSESRLDIAERIIRPKTLGDMASPHALQRLQTLLASGVESRRGKPRSVNTTRGYVAAVLASLNWAYLQDWLSIAPKLKKVSRSRQKVMKGRPITDQEYMKMLEAVESVVGARAKDSWGHVLEGLWCSALRLDELMNMSWDKPNTIRPVWSDKALPVLSFPAHLQKNNTAEDIPLLPWFEKLLKMTPAEEHLGWVFNPRSFGRRSSKAPPDYRPQSEWVGKVISRIGKSAGILVDEGNEVTGRSPKYASAHDLRRSCGERMRNAGVPPLIICRVMRHASWDTTRMHYVVGNIQTEAATLAKLLG